MKIFPKTVLTAFAVILVTGFVAACSPNPNGMGVADFGTVTGRIVDTDSLQPISGATIAIGNIVSLTAAVDQGGFVLRNVPIGTQTVEISAIGWKSYRTTVKVTKNQPTDIGTIGLPSALNR